MKIDEKMKTVKDIATISWSWHKSILILSKKLDDEELYTRAIRLQTDAMLEFMLNVILRMEKNNKVRKKLADYYSKEMIELMDSHIDENIK